MLDFEVQRCTRRCAESGRDLLPGEAYYSVLVPQGSCVARLDYAAEAWQGPPENALGWWQARLPEVHGGKMHWAPNDVMLHYFEQLQEQADKQDVRYVLALLMIRRRMLRLEETEKDPAGHDVLVLFCPRNETQYRVDAVLPDDARALEIQNELAELLYSDKGD